jgi:predicted nucleotidyltransferase component of viral defense system
MLNKKDLQEAISAARQHTTLSEAVIEKDYYVTRAISVLSQLENPIFKLIFSGGTCLAKAHKVISRMSEDIDFKIAFHNNGETISRSRAKSEIKRFRENILSELRNTEFKFEDNDINVKNEGKYIQIYLNYPSSFSKVSGLRPQLQLEFTFSEPREPINHLQVKTLIQEILGDVAALEKCDLPCISITETLSEKWVGLTRRVAAIKRGYLKEDDYLIRHLYDITTINSKNKIGERFFALVSEIIQQDAAQFKTQHPEYSDTTRSEIYYSLELLENDPYWKKCYEDFIDIMIFDNSQRLQYPDALTILKDVSQKVKIPI